MCIPLFIIEIYKNTITYFLSRDLLPPFLFHLSLNPCSLLPVTSVPPHQLPTTDLPSNNHRCSICTDSLSGLSSPSSHFSFDLWFWFLKFSFRRCGFVGFDLWGFEFNFHLLIYWFCCWSMYDFINLLQNNLLLIYGFD
jgi:hypothetical protein